MLKHFGTRVIAAAAALCMLLSMAALAAPAGLTQLGTPTNLTWGVWYDSDDQSSTLPGAMSWDRVEPSQNKYQIMIYRQGEAEPIYRTTHTFYSGYTASKFSVYHLIDGVENPESGSYYFTVQALGDGTQYSDSEVATSEAWTYTSPGQALPQVTSLWWDGTTMVWEGLDDESHVYGYETEISFSETADGEPRAVHSVYSRDSSQHEQELPEEVLAEYGDGCYTFRVRALTTNAEAIWNSPWSEPSAVRNQGQASGSVEDKLDEILEDATGESSDVTAIQSALEALDREELAAAMAADTGNSGAAQKIQALEEKANVTVNTTVAQEMQGSFSADDITVIGAGLNAASAGSGVTFEIGQVEKPEAVIEEQYQNALQFSMGLTGGVTEDSTLKVPVKITLPVPAGINPDFLVILHYHADGTYEEIRPYIDQKGGKSFATFVVTSFSTFVMAERHYAVTIRTTPGNASVSVTTAAGGAIGPDMYEVRDGYSIYHLTNGSYAYTVSAPEYYTQNGSFTVSGADQTISVTLSREGGSGGGGGGGSSGSASYTVSAPSHVDNGSVKLDASRARRGDTVTITVTPDAGYVLDTLTVTDSRGNKLALTSLGGGRYTFVMPAGRVTVDASFRADTGAALPFDDVPEDAWYRDAVAWAYEAGLVNGTGEGTFSPDLTTDRAMLAALLHRLEGGPAASGAAFPDVASGAWYAGAVAWASANGIVNGGDDGGFHPADPVTREQMVVMLYRYAQYKGHDTTQGGMAIREFADYDSISGYAAEAMAWAVNAGLVNGGDGGRLDPQGTATRAQIAALLMRFCEAFPS